MDKNGRLGLQLGYLYTLPTDATLCVIGEAGLSPGSVNLNEDLLKIKIRPTVWGFSCGNIANRDLISGHV